MGYNGDQTLTALFNDPDVYGPGTDGDVTLNGAAITVDGTSISPSGNVYTLTRELYARNLTINSPYSLRAAGFSVRVNGTLAGDLGTQIHDNGVTSTGATGGAGLSSSAQLSGRFSGGGGAGRTTTAGNGSNAIYTNAGGGAGGNGGGSGIYTGGVAAVTPRPEAGRPDDTSMTVFSRIRPQSVAYNGGGGGGGGARNTGGSGGGGGGGGGVLQVFARIYNYNGTLSAVGGDGRVGTTDSGGGGGGGGGVIVLITSQELVVPTFNVSGGAPGGGAGGGVAGMAGNSGSVFYGKLG